MAGTEGVTERVYFTATLGSTIGKAFISRRRTHSRYQNNVLYRVAHNALERVELSIRRYHLSVGKMR